MRAKDYLKQIKVLSTKIDQLYEELRQLEMEMASVKGINFDEKSFGSGFADDATFVKRIYRKMSLENEIQNIVDDLALKRHVIITQIQNIPNPLYMKVLFDKYVKFKSAEEIGQEIGYCTRRIDQLHGHALLEFEKYNSEALKD